MVRTKSLLCQINFEFVLVAEKNCSLSTLLGNFASCLATVEGMMGLPFNGSYKCCHLQNAQTFTTAVHAPLSSRKTPPSSSTGIATPASELRELEQLTVSCKGCCIYHLGHSSVWNVFVRCNFVYFILIVWLVTCLWRKSLYTHLTISSLVQCHTHFIIVHLRQNLMSERLEWSNSAE